MKVPATSSSILLATALASGTAMAAPAVVDRPGSDMSLLGHSCSMSRATKDAESDQAHQARGLGDLLGSLPILGQALCDPTLSSVLGPVLDLLGLKPSNCGTPAEAAAMLSAASLNIPKLSPPEVDKLKQAIQMAVDTISKKSNGNVLLQTSGVADISPVKDKLPHPVPDLIGRGGLTDSLPLSGLKDKLPLGGVKDKLGGLPLPVSDLFQRSGLTDSLPLSGVKENLGGFPLPIPGLLQVAGPSDDASASVVPSSTASVTGPEPSANPEPPTEPAGTSSHLLADGSDTSPAAPFPDAPAPNNSVPSSSAGPQPSATPEPSTTPEPAMS